MIENNNNNNNNNKIHKIQISRKQIFSRIKKLTIIFIILTLLNSFINLIFEQINNTLNNDDVTHVSLID
jgi:hypothetical protein